MRAVVIHDWTLPEQLVATKAAKPVCGAGQVCIRVQSAAVSHSLSLMVQGKYQRRPAFPFIPGGAAAGYVEFTGTEARRFRAGDRVIVSLEIGALAEYVVAPEANVYAIPDVLPFSSANALTTAYNSALAALTWPHLLNVTAGQTLLVHGGAGGVGTAAIEMARVLGADVIATASSEAKREWALARGAAHAIPSEAALLRDAVMQITNGRGVAGVLDPVGGALFEESLRCLKPEGRIVPLGFASGDIPRVPANLLLVKNITVCGLYMGYYKFDARERYEAQVRQVFDTLSEWVIRGYIQPETAAVFALKDVAGAFAAVLQRDRIGHVALLMNEEARRYGLEPE